ncbi:MAG: 5'-nucleotidase, lipoprotein e(P4) family [Sphingobacteriales bacterium]|jgi:5'-nucleotidase (lipoprotein e(P4) family)|nr:5'-nucleotidase, lipoprotein e(P4) family [Sphingobacteriales bacterium]
MRRLFFFLSVAALSACYVPKTAVNKQIEPALLVNGKLWSSFFIQSSAEYDALCYQAYNFAKFSLDEVLKAPSGKPLAVVTDIDETVLDNSPYAVHRALEGKDFDARSWYEWTSKAEALPLPGSLDFFNYAASKGVTVFYLTNRDEAERKATLENLKKYKYPFSDDSHLILKQSVSSKESRRQTIAENFNIVLLIGDNLSDFSTLWDKKTKNERSKNVELTQSEFGKKYIVLPNPNYGGWEDAIYGNMHNLTTAQKDSAIKANLKGY